MRNMIKLTLTEKVTNSLNDLLIFKIPGDTFAILSPFLNEYLGNVKDFATSRRLTVLGY